MMGRRDFLGGIFFLGNPFRGEDFYCRTTCKSLLGRKDFLGEYPYSYTGAVTAPSSNPPLCNFNTCRHMTSHPVRAIPPLRLLHEPFPAWNTPGRVQPRTAAPSVVVCSEPDGYWVGYSLRDAPDCVTLM